jgi:hypothetical protein
MLFTHIQPHRIYSKSLTFNSYWESSICSCVVFTFLLYLIARARNHFESTQSKRYHSTVLPSVSHNGSQDCLSPCRNLDWRVSTASWPDWTPCHVEFIVPCQNIRRLISHNTTVYSPTPYLSDPGSHVLRNIRIPFHEYWSSVKYLQKVSSYLTVIKMLPNYKD